MHRIYRLIGISIFLELAFLLPVSAANLNSAMQSSFEKLSDTYARQFPAKSTKRGLAVLPFKEESPQAKSKGLGNTVREILAGRVVTSQIFFLVDRDSLEASLKEVQLSMTGIVDEKTTTEAGKISGVRVFLSGSISELQGDMVITMRLIETDSGKVVAQESATVKAREVLDKKREIEFAYIAQYGLGINFQQSWIFMKSPLSNTSATSTDVFLNYRPYLWLNFKLGVNNTGMKLGSSSYSNVSDIYPQLPAIDRPSMINYNGGGMDLLGPYVGVDFNWTPSEKFTLGLGVSFSTYSSPKLIQNYNPGYVWNDANNNGIIEAGEKKTGGQYSVEQTYYGLNIFRLELKPQYFISPRLTLGVYLAYMFSPPMKVYKSTINNESAGFPGEGGENSVEAQAQLKRFYGMPPTILGDNKNANDLTFNGAFAAGVSLNFYF